MSNPGQYPIDADTPVGSLRLLVGDTSSTPFEPDIAGLRNYAVWSDAALANALTVAGTAHRAAGDLFAALAAQYAQLGQSVKTDDLGLDTRGRGDTLMDVAKFFYGEADGADAREAFDFFQVVPRASRHPQYVRPEATPWPIIDTFAVTTTASSGEGLDGGTP